MKKERSIAIDSEKSLVGYTGFLAGEIQLLREINKMSDGKIKEVTKEDLLNKRKELKKKVLSNKKDNGQNSGVNNTKKDTGDDVEKKQVSR